jgi:hypothetical protein
MTAQPPNQPLRSPADAGKAPNWATWLLRELWVPKTYATR